MINKFWIAVLLCCCISCSNKAEESENKSSESKADTLNTERNVQESEASKITYSITVERIDSLAYYRAKNSVVKKKPIEKITDFKIAQKLLAGIVEFESVDGSKGFQAVKKIYFRNGKKLESREDFDGETFVAYFPSEDILLCEGGHTSDMSFNLKNGKRTEEIGNPDVISASPRNNFRLNGYFGGQECYSYFLQKKKNGEFEKVIQLDEEFEKITNHWLCTVSDSFWVDEKTLYLTEKNLGDKTEDYFKVILK